MKTNKGKVIVALLAAVMMMVMAVPSISAAPTAGDKVTRVALDESALYGLRIEYRNYGYPAGFPEQWGNSPGAWAGQMNVTVTDDQSANPSRLGEIYTAFCLDFYESITGGDVLMVDSGLDTYLNAEDALIVNYILAMNEPVDDLSGAATQCAIWYFLTENFGSFDAMVAALPAPGVRTLADVQYQFMTDPAPSDPVNDMYDAKINTALYPAYAPDDLRNAAFDIIDAVIAAEPALSYPYSITVTPETQTVNVGDPAPFIIEVRDQYGSPFAGASVKVSWMYDAEGIWHNDVETTNVSGQIAGNAISSIEDTFHINACILGGEAIWVYDPADPMVIQSLVIPNEVRDNATAVWEQKCYFPDGHTPGFWKENAKKNIEKFWALPYLGPSSGVLYSKIYRGNGIQVPYEDYQGFLDAIEGKYASPGTWKWLYFNGSWAAKLDAAFKILNYGGSDPMLKAQKHMLSALLTWEWYEASDPGYYGAGCVHLSDGSDMNIDDAIADMLDAYATGDFELAHEIAGALNEQGNN